LAQPEDQIPEPANGSDNDRGADQRAAPRFMLLIRAAKLIVDNSREFLCVIRDASSTGLKIRLFNPLPPHRTLAVEMSNGDRYPLEQVWSEGEFGGFRFGSEVDVQRLLDETNGTFPKRQVRLRINLDGVLHSGGEALRVAFQDISQQGACIESDKWLLMNELVRIETDVMPPLYAKVRWRSHPRYGLLFEQTFKLDELARIAAPLQTGEHERDALNHPERFRRP